MLMHSESIAMTTSARNQPPAKAKSERPVDEFLSSVESLVRSVPEIQKLPRKRLLEQLSASHSPAAETHALLRHLGTLTRKFEQIRLTLQDNEVRRLADEAARQSAAHHEALVRESALLEPAEFAARLNWTRQALSKALTSNRVFFVEVQGSRYFPAFFTDPRYERRHLEAVSKSLGTLPGATKLWFMSSPKGSLAGETPLQALAKGKVADAVRAAEGFLEG
jgi:hypothetical protein